MKESRAAKKRRTTEEMKKAINRRDKYFTVDGTTYRIEKDAGIVRVKRKCK